MCMSIITVDDAMKTLYQMASGPYVQYLYATRSRQFKLDPMLVTPRREFKLDTMLMVPPPGSDPGSPDFQSGAMTTSAKEAGAS